MSFRVMLSAGLSALASAAAAAAGPLSSGVPTEALVELHLLAAGEVAALLGAWGVPSIAAGCASAGGCSGRRLVDVAAGLLSGQLPDEFAQQVLASAGALDAMTLAREVARASANGGVPERLLASTRRGLAVDGSSSGVWIRNNDSAVVFGTEGDVRLARTGDRALTLDSALAMEGALTVGGDAVVTGAVVAGSADFSGGIVVGGDASVGGAIAVGSADVSGDVAAGGDVLATGELSGASCAISGDLVVGDGLEVVGLAEFADDVTIDGHLEVEKTISTGFGRITRDFHQYVPLR